MKNLLKTILLTSGFFISLQIHGQAIYESWINEGNRQYEQQQYDR